MDQSRKNPIQSSEFFATGPTLVFGTATER